MPIQNVSYGAGLRNAWVKISDGTVFDIDAIVEVGADKEQTEVEVKGDDELKVTFVSNVKETLTLKANAITFDVLQSITSNAFGSSSDGLEMPLGTIDEMNPPYVEIGAETAGKDKAGNNVTIKKVWHKVQIKAVKINTAAETEMSVEMSGVAYQTETNVQSVALPSKRVATITVE